MCWFKPILLYLSRLGTSIIITIVFNLITIRMLLALIAIFLKVDQKTSILIIISSFEQYILCEKYASTTTEEISKSLSSTLYIDLQDEDALV